MGEAGMGRIKSRRVINEKVIGSANPVARWGRDSRQSCFGAFSGFFVGLLMFGLTFLLPFNAARTEKDSKDVAKLQQMSVAEAADLTGKALLSGKAEAVSRLQVPRGSASDIFAFNYTVEEYITHDVTREETHTEIRDGKEIQVTEEITEEVTEWIENEDRSRSEWSDIRFGHLNLQHGQGGLKIDLPWREIYRQGDERTRLRETVEVVDGNKDCLLAIELKSGQVPAQPDFFRLTDKNKDQLVAAMNSEEESSRWMLIIFSVVLWTISFNLMLGPAMLLFNIFPVQQVGGCARGIVTALSLVAAIITTWITYVFTRYWWVVVLLLVGGAVWMMLRARRGAEVDPDMSLDDDSEPA
jgi:hypothetical protein